MPPETWTQPPPGPTPGFSEPSPYGPVKKSRLNRRIGLGLAAGVLVLVRVVASSSSSGSTDTVSQHHTAVTTFTPATAGTTPQPVLDGPSLQTHVIDPGKGWTRETTAPTGFTGRDTDDYVDYYAEAIWDGDANEYLQVDVGKLLPNQENSAVQAESVTNSKITDTRTLADGATAGSSKNPDGTSSPIAVLVTRGYLVSVVVDGTATASIDSKLTGFLDAQVDALRGY